MTSATIRLFNETEEEFQTLWKIFLEVNAGGDAFPYPADTSFDRFKQIWTQPDARSFVALEAGTQTIMGAYFIKPQWPGRGAHVATATYMVAKNSRGKGLGKLLGIHSIEAASAIGYKAMQFNFVISTNEAAVKLWQSLGFEIVGTLPEAFDHATLGLVDAYVMYRFLNFK